MNSKNNIHTAHQAEQGNQQLISRFRVLNYYMLIGVVFGFIIGFLGSQGIMKIGNVQPIADYVFAIFNIGLIWTLYINKKYYLPVAWLFVISTLLLFIVALVSVDTDEARVVWFYITVYVAYMLLGVRSGIIFTFIAVVSIVVISFFVDLNISDTAISTYLIALILLSVLARAHALHIADYENKLKAQTKLLESNFKNMNKSLVEAESANRVKSLFLANMGHEIRTPMNGILSLTQVLEMTSLDKQQAGYLKSIKFSGDSLLALIDDLLDLSKIESDTFVLNNHVFKTKDLVRGILQQAEPFIEESTSSFKSIVADDLPVALMGDLTRLIQVVVNFISNAAKFTSNGEIELRINGCYVEEGFLFLIEVEDNGIGIPDDQQENIFEVFQQLSAERIAKKGVGLGLALCNKIIKKMKGSIRVVSKQNKGSCFSVGVELPVFELDDEDDLHKEHKAKKNLKILVFEDDPISKLAVKMLLEHQGCIVELVENGVQGIELLSQAEFDVVLMDINMPILDGIETTRLIKEKALTNAPIIGMTASIVDQERDRYFEIGMSAIVEKPIKIEYLMDVFSKHL